MYVEHDRRSLRLQGYDYTSLGAYFLTICAFEQAQIFGTIRDGIMKLSWLGEIVRDEWLKTGAIRSDIRLDEFVIMPNHVHAVIWIMEHRYLDDVGCSTGGARSAGVTDTPDLFCRGTMHCAPTKQIATPAESRYRAPLPERFGKPIAGSIPTVMRMFKAAVSRKARQMRPAFGDIWQRGYYDRIIRDDREMDAIREYVRNNPMKWSEREE